jgi:hypothetical protein
VATPGPVGVRSASMRNARESRAYHESTLLMQKDYLIGIKQCLWHLASVSVRVAVEGGATDNNVGYKERKRSGKESHVDILEVVT